MAVRYPSGPLTPHGWYHITHGTRPMMQLQSHDGSIDIQLLGGLAPPFHDPTQPEAVALKSLKGLIAPWRHLDQKGATQDGVTNIDSLYEPIEIEAVFDCIGRDPKTTMRVARDLIGAIDAKLTSPMGWLTHDLGYWWSDIRWHKGAPSDPLEGAQTCKQRWSLRLRADHGFWRSFDDSDMFNFVYDDMTDQFDTDTDSGAGPNWPDPHYYGGAGGGYVRVRNGQLVWIDDPDDPFTTEGLSVMLGPYKDFNTTGDNQVVSTTLGSLQEFTLPDGAENHLWARVGRNPDGSWDGSGVRASIGFLALELSYFQDFVETSMRTVPLGVPILGGLGLWLPPMPGDKFTLVAGFAGNPRKFQVQRNGLPILNHVEVGAGSPLGPTNRGVGGGMRAGGALITQATPASMRHLSAGDNAAITQSGFLSRLNVGDQPMYDDYTLFGPFTKVKIYDGPNSDEYVEFGPALPNQIVFLRTDPRSNTTLVQDLTVTPPSPQELDVFQDAVSKLLSFAGFNDSALGDQIKSQFGIRTPQGNLYKYLNGRFSDKAAIPPKSPGEPAAPYFVKVEVEGGNADTRVIVSGTPLRRYPL